MNPSVCWDPEQGQDCVDRGGPNQPGSRAGKMPLSRASELRLPSPRFLSYTRSRGTSHLCAGGLQPATDLRKLARALRQGAEVTRPTLGRGTAPTFSSLPRPRDQHAALGPGPGRSHHGHHPAQAEFLAPAAR